MEGRPKENALFIRAKEGNKITKYSPDDLTGYQLKNGKTFRSFNVEINGQSKRYFFERLFRGKINLYYLNVESDVNKFYITESDSLPLLPIPEKSEELVEFFNRYVQNCPQAIRNIEHVKLERNLLKRFFRDYHNCSASPLPRLRYGFALGLAADKFASVEHGGILAIPNYKYDVGLFGGAFIDVPIGSGNLSLQPGIYFKRSGNSVAFDGFEVSYDLISSYSSLTLPILLKYTFLSANNSPFLTIGPVFSRVVKKEILLYEYRLIKNDVYIDFNDMPALANNQGGISIGGGMIFKYGSTHSLFGEFRFSKLHSIFPQRKEVLNVNEALLTFGMLF